VLSVRSAGHTISSDECATGCVSGAGGARAVVAQLWRYPVKSMQGERLPAVEIQVDGVYGDRRWGVRDERTRRMLTGRREARLLEAAAETRGGQ
jgi:uncharacterized protein YcbX